MNKFLSLLGLGEMQYSFSTLDGALKRCIIKRIALCVAILVLAIIALVSGFSVSQLIFTVAVVIGAFLVVGYSYLSLCCGNYSIVTGDVIDFQKKTLTFAKRSLFGKSYVIMQCGDNRLEILMPRNSGIVPGYKLTVYFQDNNLYEDEPGYYKVSNPIAYEIADARNGILNDKADKTKGRA